MTKWLLDTNACIAVINDNPPRVKNELMKRQVAEVGISVICVYELHYGVSKSSRVQENKKTLAAFLKYMQVLEWTESCAEIAGIVRADLERVGSLIGHYDLLIAAHALSLDATLVTHNTKEFSRVSNLRLADWA